MQKGGAGHRAGRQGRHLCKGASSLMPFSIRPGRSVWCACDEATRRGRPITVIRSPAAEPPLFVTQVDDARVVQCLQKSFGVVPPHVVLQMSPQRVVPQHRLEDGGCVVVRHRMQLVHAPADLSWLHDANLSWLFAGKFAAPPKKMLSSRHVEMLAAGQRVVGHRWQFLANPDLCQCARAAANLCPQPLAGLSSPTFANIHAIDLPPMLPTMLPTLCQLSANSLPTLCQLFANSLPTL